MILSSKAVYGRHTDKPSTQGAEARGCCEFEATKVNSKELNSIKLNSKEPELPRDILSQKNK